MFVNFPVLGHVQGCPGHSALAIHRPGGPLTQYGPVRSAMFCFFLSLVMTLVILLFGLLCACVPCAFFFLILTCIDECARTWT